MKCLIIGGNRFVGLRLSLLLESIAGMDLHILNRTGQAPHCRNAAVYKADRKNLPGHYLDRDWDLIFDFAGFTAGDALGARDFFQKVGLYVFISSASVYENGANLKEEAFKAELARFDGPQDANQLYREGKRRAEAVFSQQNKFPVCSVRFPFILGPDDYTQRLAFHIEHVRNGQPIFLPVPQAFVSLVHSDDAAQFLAWLVDHPMQGPVNVASPKPIALKQMLGLIESVVGRPAILSKKASTENHSPYGVDGDFALNVEKMQKAGFTTRPVHDWLLELIGSPSEARPKGYLH